MRNCWNSKIPCRDVLNMIWIMFRAKLSHSGGLDLHASDYAECEVCEYSDKLWGNANLCVIVILCTTWFSEIFCSDLARRIVWGMLEIATYPVDTPWTRYESNSVHGCLTVVGWICVCRIMPNVVYTNIVANWEGMWICGWSWYYAIRGFQKLYIANWPEECYTEFPQQ